MRFQRVRERTGFPKKTAGFYFRNFAKPEEIIAIQGYVLQ